MTTTLRTAIKSKLSGDSTLMTILTGGVFDRRGISRTGTPAAYDSNGTIKPCAVVTIEATTTKGPKEFDFEQVFFQVWLFEAEGNHYVNIDPARDRVRALLHRATVTISPGGVHEIIHADSLGDSYDDALGAEMTFERFYAWRHRA